MTPEQREKKKQADRDRRARLKAQGLDAKAIRNKAAAGQAARLGVRAGLEAAQKVKATNRRPAASPLPTVNTPTIKTATKLAQGPRLNTARKRQAREPSGGVDKMVVISFRGTAEHKARFDELGGGTWARKQIERAAR